MNCLIYKEIYNILWGAREGDQEHLIAFDSASEAVSGLVSLRLARDPAFVVPKMVVLELRWYVQPSLSHCPTGLSSTMGSSQQTNIFELSANL